MGAKLTTDGTVIAQNETDIPWYKLYAEHFKLLFDSEDPAACKKGVDALPCVSEEGEIADSVTSFNVKNVEAKHGDTEVATEYTECTTSVTSTAATSTEATSTEATTTEATSTAVTSTETESEPLKHDDAKDDTKDDAKELELSDKFHEWVYVSKTPVADCTGTGVSPVCDTTPHDSSHGNDGMEKVEISMLEDHNIIVHNVTMSVDLSTSNGVQSDVNSVSDDASDVPAHTVSDNIHEIPEITESMLERAELTDGITEVTDEITEVITEEHVESAVVQSDLEEIPDTMPFYSELSPLPSHLNTGNGGKPRRISSISFAISPKPSVSEDEILECTDGGVECQPPDEIVYDDQDYDVTEERQSVRTCISFWEAQKPTEDLNKSTEIEM